MSYKIIPSDPSLVAAWDMSQSIAGTVHDVGPGDYNGTLVGHPRQGQDSFGKYLNFDGVDGYVQGSVSSSTYPFTLSSWFRTEQVTDGTMASISDSASSVRVMGIQMISGKVRIIAYNSSLGLYSSPLSYNDGKLHNATVVFLSDVSKLLYMDGSYIGELTTSITMPVVDTFLSGVLRLVSPNAYADGNIYSAAIYSEAKSPEWIQQEYNRAKRYF